MEIANSAIFYFASVMDTTRTICIIFFALSFGVALLYPLFDSLLYDDLMIEDEGKIDRVKKVEGIAISLTIIFMLLSIFIPNENAMNKMIEARYGYTSGEVAALDESSEDRG